jgi:hypothetical protein
LAKNLPDVREAVLSLKKLRRISGRCSSQKFVGSAVHSITEDWFEM